MTSEIAKNIENILQNELNEENAENAFRKIFCNILGFAYDNTYLSEIEVPKDLLDGEIKSIAKTIPSSGEEYHILYGVMKKITKTKRRKIVREIVNYFSYVEEGSFILILYDETRNVWELITYAQLLGRIQLRIFRVGPGESHRTTAENLAKIHLDTPEIGRSELSILVEEAFSVLPVTKEFFEDYKSIIEHLTGYIKRAYASVLERNTPAGVNPQLFIHRSAKAFAHTLLNRLMFIMFLQKKGWIGGRKDFLQWLYGVYNDSKGPYEFYRDFLRPLFLEILNKSKEEKGRLIESMNLPESVRDIYRTIHYYNGGLFNPLREFGINLDDIITEFKEEEGRELIRDVMEFLFKYNFTISEESPFEVEVAVDPAMLGYIYESLIAEQERGSAGIFYTPKEEVDFMCRMALYNYLSKVTHKKETLRKLLFSEEIVMVPREIIDALDEIKIVDPACGSGAFLVGIFNVIREIYEKAGIDVDFDRKKKIIRENLHGVDVKEWAVRVAELRLWLALIEDEDEMPNYEPLLPNLTPNLRVGDSLVSEGIRIDGFSLGGIKIDGVPLSIELTRDVLNSLHRKRKKIIEWKKRVFNGEMSVVEFEKERINSFVDAVAGGLQITLDDLTTEESEEIKKLIDARREHRNIQIPFLWDFDFADVMASGGFDVVIANPPYVRQENIYPEFFDPDELDLLDIGRDELKRAYKKEIIENTQKIVDTEISRRSDIYSYFFMRGINILKNGGTLVFITSNSWLDVDYGTWMQEEFLKKTHLKFVIDYPHRSFVEADVNTVITVMEKKENILLDPEEKVKFLKLKKGIGELQYEDFVEILTEYSGGREVSIFGAKVVSIDGNAARHRVVDEVNLARLGEAQIQRASMIVEERYTFSNYKGAKWGGLLIRAPEIFYTILKKGEGKLVRLGDIAEVRFGIKTGANEFFYLEPIKNPDDWPVCEICGKVHTPDEGLVAVKNKAGWIGYIEEEFLKPVVKSPQEIKSVFIDTENLKNKLFICSKSKNTLRKTGIHALNYIKWGEKRRYHYRPTCASRSKWWDVGTQKIPFAVWFKSFNDRFLVPFNKAKVYCSDRMYALYKKDCEDVFLLSASLNSTMNILIAELMGRVNLGEGALDNMTYEAGRNICLNPKVLTHNSKIILGTIYNKIDQRYLKSIFEELGLPKPTRDLSNINPEDVTLDKVMPDRRELDRIIFEALGLSEEEQLEGYRAVVQLVKERLVKARSFGR